MGDTFVSNLELWVWTVAIGRQSKIIPLLRRTIKCIVGRVARIAKAAPHLPLRHLHLHLREIATQFQLLLLMIGANRIVPWDSAQQICVSAKSTSGFPSEWFFLASRFGRDAISRRV